VFWLVLVLSFVLYTLVLYCTLLFCTVHSCFVLYTLVLYTLVLYCTLLYCTPLFCTVHSCFVLYTLVLQKSQCEEKGVVLYCLSATASLLFLVNSSYEFFSLYAALFVVTLFFSLNQDYISVLSCCTINRLVILVPFTSVKLQSTVYWLQLQINFKLLSIQKSVF
jgi:hypothetical protein